MASSCQICGNTIELSLEAINQLRRELGEFQEASTGKWNHFEARIEVLAALAQVQPETPIEPTPFENPAVAEIIETPELEPAPILQGEPEREPVAIEPPAPELEPLKLEPEPLQPELLLLLIEAPEQDIEQVAPVPQAPAAPRKPSQLKILLGEMLFAPIAQVKEYGMEVFLHYKSQNKLPVFFMTIAGMVALLFGFGYLMQFATNEVFKYIKIGSSFAAITWIILWGANLVRKHEKYREFGSALMGLGISLNYLVLYFLSDGTEFPILATHGISLALIVANSILASWLALRYETKVVAVISLLGGAFAPFYLHTDMISGFYFAYLWLLCASSIYVAHRINWKPLANLAFLVTAGVTEWVVFLEPGSIPVPIFAVLLHAFAGLFLYYTLFERSNPKFMLAREDVAMMVATLSLFLLNLFVLFKGHDSSVGLGMVYLIDGVIFIAGFFLLRNRLHRRMQALSFGLAATFAGFAIPALFGQHLMGAFWAVEGMALVFCGFTFALPSVRKEGYVLLLVALARISWSFGSISTGWGETLWTGGFWNLLIIGPLAFGLMYLVNQHKRSRKEFETRIAYGLFEGLSFWAVASLLTAGFFYLEVYAMNLALPLILALIYWGNQNKLRITEWLGIALIGLFVGAYLHSAGLVDSFRFTQQSFSGKLALVEILGLMWALQTYYEKLMPENPRLLLMRFSREVFYILLPLIWLPSVNRHFPDLLPFALVVSAAMSFVMSEVLREKLKLVALPFLRNQGYLVLIVLAFIGLGSAIMLVESWGESIWKIEYASILLLGPVAWLLRRFLTHHRTKAANWEKGNLSYALSEAIPIWLGMVLMTIGAYYLGWWVCTLVPLAMMAHIWWGNRQQLALTEGFGLLHYFLLLIGIGASMLMNFSGYFSDQFIWGQLLIGEALLCLWILQAYYEQIAPESKHLPKMKQLRELFFLLVPIVALPSIWHHAESYFAIGVWGAASISFVLAEFTGHKSLRIELRLLVIAGTILAIAQASFLSVGMGLVVLFGIWAWKQGYRKQVCKTSLYKGLFNYAFYYLGLSLFLLVLKINEFDTIVSALAFPAFYFGALAYFRRHIPAIRRSYRFAYRVGFLLMMLSLFVFLVDTTEGLNLYDTRFEWVNILFLVAVMAIFHLNLYRKIWLYPRKPEAFVWRFDQIMLHLCNIMAYMGILSFLTHDWSGIGLTIALIVHGIILLFNSAQPRFAFLMRFALGIIAAAFAKLFLFDFAHFTPAHKVIVCMVVGLLLLVGSRLFLKYRDSIATR